jgi:hypothetical protein
MDKQQEAGPSKQGPSKSPKGRRKAPASSTSGNSPKRAKVATPPLGTEQNPVRIDSGSSADSVVCLDPLPAAERSPITESDDSVVSIDLQAESTDSFTDGPSNPGSPENHPNRYSSSSEEDGWISYRPTVKQAQQDRSTTCFKDLRHTKLFPHFEYCGRYKGLVTPCGFRGNHA